MTDGPAFTKSPTIAANPNANVPLVAIVEFETNRPTTARLTVSGPTGPRSFEPGNETKSHRIPVVGLRAATRYEINVTASNTDGSTRTNTPLVFTTTPLPANFPPYRVLKCDAARREPGYTFFNIGPGPARAQPRPPDQRPKPYMVGIDQEGEIIYYKTPGSPARWLRNGNFLTTTMWSITEWNLAGDIVQHWHTPQFDGELPAGSIALEWDRPLHHCIQEMPDGNFLALAETWHQVEDYPSSEVEPDKSEKEPVRVIGDASVEIDRATGTTIRAHDLFEILDPCRLSYGSLSPLLAQRGGDPDTRDWTHCNSLIHDPRDESFIFSVRHQDAIVKIDRQTGALKWILGDPGNWKSPWKEKLLTPLGDLDWQYHQHDLSITAEGNLLCFDNGNHRCVPPGDKIDPTENRSRAVEFAIDEQAMTVRQAWSFGSEGQYHIYSTFVSGAERCPTTGNTFLTYGGISNKKGHGFVAENDIADHMYVTYVEVTPGADSEIVFEATVRDDTDENWFAFNSFRSDHRTGF